jgi:hypothetical protein
MRRLLSLATWAQLRAQQLKSLHISARVPSDCQPAALKTVAKAALAAAGSLQDLILIANRGFWPGSWLPRLLQLRSLRLCSKQGGLSLHGDLAALTQLTSLALEAKYAVTMQDHVRWELLMLCHAGVVSQASELLVPTQHTYRTTFQYCVQVADQHPGGGAELHP